MDFTRWRAILALLAEAEGQRKKKTVKVFGTNCLPKTSVREGAKRAHTLLTLIQFKKQWLVVYRTGHEAQMPEPVTPQFCKELRTLTAHRAMSQNKSFLKFSVKESRSYQGHIRRVVGSNIN